MTALSRVPYSYKGDVLRFNDSNVFLCAKSCELNYPCPAISYDPMKVRKIIDIQLYSLKKITDLLKRE